MLGTKDLADHFGRTVRRPHRTYIAGVSMGGYVIGRSLEQYPGFYDGALPMCGVLGDQTLLDFFLDYNLVAQALAGVPAHPTPADYLTNAVPRIQVALGLAGLTPTGPDTTNDRGKQLRAITVEPFRWATSGRRRGVRGLEGLPLLDQRAHRRAATPPRSGPASCPPTCSPATPRTAR